LFHHGEKTRSQADFIYNSSSNRYSSREAGKTLTLTKNG